MLIPAVLFLSLVLGCSPRPALEDSPPAGSDEELLQITCEKSLSHLRILIEDKQSINKDQSFRIIEAQEILRLAQTLYLEEEYTLALEMIEHAIEILVASGN